MHCFVMIFFKSCEKQDILDNKKSLVKTRLKNGAGEGIRTLDINLGKVALYP